MKIEIKIPNMGESISEATVGMIFVSNGQQVETDGELLELETDKVNQVLFAPQGGVVKLNIKLGDTVKVGQVIGSIETEASPKQTKSEEIKKEPESIKVPSKPSSEEPIRKTKESFLEELKETKSQEEKPVVSKKTKEIESISTTTSSKDRETRQPMSKIRKVIAKKMVEAQQTTAMLTTFNEVDMSQVILLREKYQEAFTKQYGTKLGFMSFFVEAVTSALQAFPNLNSYIDGEDSVHRDYYNIGIAVGTDKGTFVPILRDTDQMSFSDVELAIDAFAKKAKEGTLTMDDLQNGGFTITNGGVYGSLLSTPILNPPQSGILGMHKIEKRPVVVNDQIVIRPMMYLALSYDHRIVDGKESVAFLVHIKNILEDPSRLLLHV
jgi:2-oxoglutarate dehydrogenase E2 component (dihydrolipoamide succinyltransferase)